MKVAVVYDRVNKWGGAERVLLALNEMFPEAPLYTAVYHKGKASWARVFSEVVPSFLQKTPFTKDKHELLGLLTPIAFETFNFDGYDLVISVTSEAAKGVLTKPETYHICYCLTPTRYLWSHYDFYFDNPPAMFSAIPFFKKLTKPMINYLKTWDKIAAQRPDKMVGISNAVCERIKRYYQRESELIYPPTEIKKFQNNEQGEMSKKQDYFLYVSRLIPYKRPDLAVEVFNDLGLPLVVVGTGSEETKLRRMAKENVRFTGEVAEEKLALYYREARALVFPAEEDFGLVMVEAQAAGTPVIAYKKGGALDIVEEDKTGIFFGKQEKENMAKAVKKFEKVDFDKSKLYENAAMFSKEKFKRDFGRLIRQSL